MITLSELSKAALALPLAHRTVLNEHLWNGIHGSAPAPIILSEVDDVISDADTFCASHGIAEERSPGDLEQLPNIAENAMTLSFDERLTLAQDVWQSIHAFC
jgi:hypothetical protein